MSALLESVRARREIAHKGILRAERMAHELRLKGRIADAKVWTHAAGVRAAIHARLRMRHYRMVC